MQLTEAQEKIKSRLDKGMTAPQIARDLGISRNAVYQQIQRMRRNGVLAPNYTPTGVPPRERPGEDLLTKLLDGSDGHHDEVELAAARALMLELRRTRDELAAIVHRVDSIVGR